MSDERDIRHRLRTPLNHIVGYCELLLDVAGERGLEDIARDLRKIRAAAGELQAALEEHFAGGEPAAEEPPAVAPASFGRVLVVDDDANNREIATRILERAGYAVVTASDGEAAIALVAADPPDLVLLDVLMPGLDGIEVCRRLKADPATRLIPIVIMTSLGRVEDRVRGIEAGADAFLTKPPERAELLARIRTSLRHKRIVDGELRSLRGTQAYLERFVPQSVRRSAGSPLTEQVEQDLSALFVDVIGYVRLSEQLGQGADALVESTFSGFLDVIHGHDGDVTETSGDGMMVVFLGEDHAVRAVRAALAILARTAAPAVLAVHVGVNSGPALLGPVKYAGASGSRWTYTALGPVVNLAARVAAVAEGGELLIGPETARRIEGHFATEELAAQKLKNVSGEVRMRRVLPPRP